MVPELAGAVMVDCVAADLVASFGSSALRLAYGSHCPR